MRVRTKGAVLSRGGPALSAGGVVKGLHKTELKKKGEEIPNPVRNKEKKRKKRVSKKA